MARYLSGPTLPYGKWNNVPIYLTTILTAVFVVGVIGTALLTAAHSSLLNLFVLRIPQSPAWSIWSIFTYVAVNPVNFFTPFSIAFFYIFSIGIETHLGRAVLSRLLILLTLVPAAVGTLAYWGLGVPSGIAGNTLLTASLMVAFATLYPNTEAMGWVPYKWVAAACIFCGSLMMLADRDVFSLIELWLSCGVAFACIRRAKEVEYDDYVSPMSKVRDLFRRKPKFRVMPSPNAAGYRPKDPDPDSELDTLLDKIAKSGMGSLTAKEKATLQKAREALMRKDQH